MQGKIVIDASAILALINNEKGQNVVEKVLNNAIVSSVNISEVITIANRNGINETEIIKLLKDIFPHIIDFNYEQACIAAALDKITKKYGLSLGDRACLALAKYKNCPVLTANKIWKKLDIAIDVRLVR